MDSYKSLIAWQRANDLSLTTLEILDDVHTPRAAFVFEQLRRAVLSVDLNIVEGYALNTPALFRRHLRIAFGSAAEAERIVDVALARGYLTADQGHQLHDLAADVLRLLAGLMRSPRLRGKG